MRANADLIGFVRQKFPGKELSAKIEFAGSDMSKPHFRMIREKCSQALPFLDGFRIVAKGNGTGTNEFGRSLVSAFGNGPKTSPPHGNGNGKIRCATTSKAFTPICSKWCRQVMHSRIGPMNINPAVGLPRIASSHGNASEFQLLRSSPVAAK